ncbi:hypothetical protein SDC9_99194 [bioreactor metagenome]|uniref:HTH cro/C1-type domain-containing protein n=1 Tax=bioreactor metagenome TaxID=1076179 RepID=A0A645AGW5_9ZZZZ
MTKLKMLRKKRGLKITEVADKLSASPQAVWQQEHRGIQTINTAKRYAVVLDCSPLDILEL